MGTHAECYKVLISPEYTLLSGALSLQSRRGRPPGEEGGAECRILVLFKRSVKNVLHVCVCVCLRGAVLWLSWSSGFDG